MTAERLREIARYHATQASNLFVTAELMRKDCPQRAELYLKSQWHLCSSNSLTEHAGELETTTAKPTTSHG